MMTIHNRRWQAQFVPLVEDGWYLADDPPPPFWRVEADSDRAFVEAMIGVAAWTKEA